MINKIYSFKKITSTQDFAKKLIKSGLVNSDRVLVTSEIQTKGRGRFNRKWISPLGGVYFSLIMKKNDTLLSFKICLAICKTIEYTHNIKVQIRWPNDLILNGKKIGGMLIEKIEDFSIIGVGINLNTDIELLPPHSTSLFFETSIYFEKEKFLNKLLEFINEYLNYDSKKLIREYKSYSQVLGKFVKIRSLNKTLEGQVIDFDSEGALILRDNFGFKIKLFSSEVIFLR